MKKISYNAPVTLTFTLLSLLALALNALSQDQANMVLFSTYRSSLADPLFYVRLFTHVLGHVSLQHFTNNFMIILLLGPLLEEKYGGKRLAGMIAGTACITGIINALFFPHTRLLGASGIAFMFILLSSFVQGRQGTVPLTLIITIIFYLGNQIVQGLFSRDQISQISHLIGGASGILYGYMYRRK